MKEKDIDDDDNKRVKCLYASQVATYSLFNCWSLRITCLIHKTSKRLIR